MRSPRIFALVAVTLLVGNLFLAPEEEKNVENFGKTSQVIGLVDPVHGWLFVLNKKKITVDYRGG
jgi:hypothetical protein